MLKQSKIVIYALAALFYLMGAGQLSAETAKPGAAQPRPAQPVERPFGGPPNRTDPVFGTTCASRKITCVLANPREIGNRCSCRTKAGLVRGKVVPSKER